MIIAVVVILLFLTSIFIFFVSPRFSPIPYFPTLDNDLDLIDQALNLKKGDVMYDLGAGDGKMLFRYARPQIKTVGVEVNPYLTGFMRLRRVFFPHKQEVEVLRQDLFKTNLTEATHIYLFVGPFLMDRIMAYVLENKGPKLKRIVSYRYDPKIKTGHGIKKTKVFSGHQKTYLLEF